MRVERVAAAAGVPQGKFDRDFLVKSQLALRLQGGALTYTVVPVESPYNKAYPCPEWPSNGTNSTFFVAKEGFDVLGCIAASAHWTGYIEIDDLVVNKAFRRAGVGLALLEEVKRWVIEHDLRGLRAETQSNNVGACALYARAGFVLAGFDGQFYSLTSKFQNEVSLFWYWQAVRSDA